MSSANLDAISDSTAPALSSGEVARGGTSLLQEQSNCPFRAFAIRRLLAKEIQGPNEALAPTERGKVLDAALQLIWEQLKDSEGLQRADLAAVVEAAVDEAMARELPSSNDPWSTRFLALERQRTIEVLTEWLALESKRKPFHVVGHQLPVEVSLGGLSLRGRLDRLDEIDDAHVVIDYKTGGSNRRERMAGSASANAAVAVLRIGDAATEVQSCGRVICGCPQGRVRRSKAICAKKICCRARTRPSAALRDCRLMSTPAKWAEELERIATIVCPR